MQSTTENLNINVKSYVCTPNDVKPSYSTHVSYKKNKFN